MVERLKLTFSHLLVHAVRANFSLLVCSPPLIDLSAVMTQGDPVANAKVLKNIELLAEHIGENEARRKASQSMAQGAGAHHKLAVSTSGSLESSLTDHRVATPPGGTTTGSTGAHPAAIGKKQSRAQMKKDAISSGKSLRASSKDGKNSSSGEGKETSAEKHKSLSQKLKLTALAHKVKHVASNSGGTTATAPVSSSGSKSARGAMEGGRKKPRGTSASSSGETALAGSSGSPRVSKPKTAASEPLDSLAASSATTGAATGSGETTPKSRHLRAPSLPSSDINTIVAEAAASMTSDSALSTSSAGIGG